MNISKCLRHQRLLLSIAICTAVFVVVEFVAFKKKAWSCCKNNEVIIVLPSARIAIPLQPACANLPFFDLEIQGTTWMVAALKAASVGDVMAELATKAPCPMMLVVRDQQEAEYLIICGKDRQLSLSSMKHLIEQKAVEQGKEKLIRLPLPGDDVRILVWR
jgi:hypothetical protein